MSIASDFKYYNKDLIFINNWSKNPKNSSIYVSKQLHFTDCPEKKSIRDQLIDWCCTNIKANESQKTAERVTQLTTQSLQEEIDVRVQQFKEDISAEILRIREALEKPETDQVALLNNLKGLVSAYRQQFNQLYEASKAMQQALKLHHSSNPQLEQQLTLVLSGLESTHEKIIACIEQPLETYINTLATCPFSITADEFNHLCTQAISTLETNSDNDKEKIKYAGFELECKVVAELISNQMNKVMLTFHNSCEPIKTILQTSDEPLEQFIALEKNLASALDQLAKLRKKSSQLSTSIPTARLGSSNAESLQVIGKTLINAFMEANDKSFHLAASFRPLENILNGNTHFSFYSRSSINEVKSVQSSIMSYYKGNRYT